MTSMVEKFSSGLRVMNCKQSLCVDVVREKHDTANPRVRKKRKHQSRVAEWLGGAESSKRSRVQTLRKRREGPKLVFRIRAYVGATTMWCSSYAASISFHSHIDYNKVLKIRGARGPVCLSHAVPVFGSKMCPTDRRMATFAHLNLRM